MYCRQFNLTPHARQRATHVKLIFPDSFPDQIVEKYRNELAVENLKLEIRRIPLAKLMPLWNGLSLP